MPEQENIAPNELPEKNNQFIIFKTDDDKISIDVRFESETAWLTQAHLAELFQTSRPNITMHIKNILEEGELQEISVCKDFLHTAADGKNYNTKYYNLDMIISLGYRINSKTATKFRQWATSRLKEYIVKGFTMDDERLKNLGGGNYWRELLDRIRDIRSSEKLIYRQVLDLYALSIDYDPKAEETLLFFKIVQNKLHYAVSGHTASEIIFNRASVELPFMGLTVFKGNRPVKSEVTIAKNYMTEKELFALRRMVNAFFDMAELKAETQEPMYMKDWLETLDKFSRDFGMGVLDSAGSVKQYHRRRKSPPRI